MSETISDFFEHWFGAKLANSRWSWGAYDETSDRVLLRVWEDEIEHREGLDFVAVHSTVDTRHSPGYPERGRHLDLIKGGAEGFAVVCRSKDLETTGPRELISFDPDTLLRLGEIIVEGESVLAQIVERVPIGKVTPKQTGFRTWIFQANPSQYDAKGALGKYEKLHWRVTRYKDQIGAGDYVYIWESGPNGGLLAQARVLGSPRELPFGPGREFLKDDKQKPAEKELQVILDIEAVLQEPLSRECVVANPVLAELQIFKQPQATNFKVTETAAQELAFLFAQEKPMPPIHFLQANDEGEDGPVSRFLKTIEAQKRSSKNKNLVKQTHGNECQLCGIVLNTPKGAYSEAAHIQPIGFPHNGPDRTQNMLCLCPNCHVLFDSGAVTVDEDHWVVGFNQKRKLRLKTAHIVGENYLKYHRENIAPGLVNE